jgi:hypothetical protein
MAVVAGQANWWPYHRLLSWGWRPRRAARHRRAKSDTSSQESPAQTGSASAVEQNGTASAVEQNGQPECPVEQNGQPESPVEQNGQPDADTSAIDHATDDVAGDAPLSLVGPATVASGTPEDVRS